jgi:adenylate kinase
MKQVISARLHEADCQQGFILDGYPRTVSQARFLDSLLTSLGIPDPLVFHFDISNGDVLSRLTRRLQCAECGRIFSMNTTFVNGDSGDGEILCDRDGSRLIHRADDNAASIRERLRLYEENASRLMTYYRTRAYHRISAARAPEEITRELLGIVRSHSSAPVLRSRQKQPASRAISRAMEALPEKTIIAP